MSIDQRGFWYIVQAEGAEFLQPQQLIQNQTVNLVEYDGDGVVVHTTGGLTITADHVLCTFSVGVLQNTDVVFQPPFPHWKVDAIHSIDMVNRAFEFGIGTYRDLGYVHKDFPSVQRNFLVLNRGKHPMGYKKVSEMHCIRWGCMLRNKEADTLCGRAWIMSDPSRALESLLPR